MKNLSLILICSLIGVACTKKKPETFVQGQGTDLLLISDYQGKEFPVETLKSIMDQSLKPVVSKSEHYDNKKDNSGKMSLVGVKTEAKLLGEDTPFLALPNNKTDYKVRYQIKKDHLVVLKVAKAEKIHSSEITAKIDPSDIGGQSDLVYVPFVAYPILGLYNVENVEENGQKSNKLTERSATSVEQAKYFKFDIKGKVLYSFAKKADLFTKEFFTGVKQVDSRSKATQVGQKPTEWFYSTTVVSSNYQDPSSLGYLLNQSSKVKFVFTQNEMKAVNVNVDPKIDLTKDVNQDIVVSIPICWKDYRRSQDAKKNYTMKEEENEKLDWTEKSHFRLCTADRDETIVSVEVDTDYFSYTVYLEEYKARIKFSFMKDQNRLAYTPKKLFESDFEKFGFFSTEKHEVDNYEKYRRSDFGHNVFVNRYNTNAKEIKFYFTEGSDESLIPKAAEACVEWTKAFDLAGVALKVTCVTDKSERKSLGDIRYNQINLIQSTKESNLFGYGPSVTDPRTGEIISATTNMHMTSIMSTLVDHIREYAFFKSGKTSRFSVVDSSALNFNDITVSGDKVSVSADSPVTKLLKKFPVLGPNGQMKNLDFAKIEVPEKRKQLMKNNFGREFSMAVTGKHLNKDIDTKCTSEIAQLVELLKSNQQMANENQFVVACAKKLLPEKMFGTLLHEMGHNLGLRHNFYASVDAKNFWTKEKTGTEEQVRSSSVMEYSSFNEDRLTRVGLYDVAALRYGYGDSVEIISESAGAKVVKIEDPNMSIDDNLSSRGLKRKPYKFCTDEDVEIGEDPMCARHDAGTNPEEIVDHLINEYNDTIVQYNYRLNRQRLINPERLTAYRIRRFWIPMKNFYDQWRYKLNDYLGLGNEFLEAYDAQQFDEKFKRAQEANPAFTNYRNAANKIFNFARRMATLPPVYCIGKAKDGSDAAVEFADVRRVIMAVGKFVPQSCLDPAVVSYIEVNNKFTPTSQSGYELEDVRLDSKIKVIGYTWFGNPIMAGPDIIGLMPEKDIAMAVLTVRTPLSLSATERRFLPNFMDEPFYRESMLSIFADRITKGIDGRRLTNKENQDGLPGFLEKFAYEKKTIENMSKSIFYDGMEIPEKMGATKERKKKYSVRYTSQKDILDRAKYKVPGLDGISYYYIMNEDATEAKRLMQMLETLPKRLEAAAPVTEKTFVKLAKLAKDHLPEKGRPDATKFLEFIYAMIEDDLKQSRAEKTTEEKEASTHRIHWKRLFKVETGALAQEMTVDPDINPANFISITGSEMEKYHNPKSTTLNRATQTYALKLSDILYKEGYELSQESVKAAISEYEKNYKANRDLGANKDTDNIEELKSQLDLIMSVLRTMTEY
jgi:polyhydroxyalkanoate synthesis regulator phasin